jgi:tetrathionate reductase subunit C
MFKDDKKWSKIMGIIGIPCAISVHGYTGFVLAVAKARAAWATPIMPLLFLVSAIISGIAMMMLVNVIQGYFFTKDRKINTELLFTLGKMQIWIIVFDLFLVFSDRITHYTGRREGMEAVLHEVTGLFGFLFLFVEVFIGKIIPLIVFAVPKFRKTWIYVLMAIIIMIGIFVMRYNVVVGGEHIPIM